MAPDLTSLAGKVAVVTGGASSTLRAMAASISGPTFCALRSRYAGSRSLNSGMTSLANSSSDSQMCSCLLLPACITKISWSTPASS